MKALDEISYEAFAANPKLYLTPPPDPVPGDLVAWVKKRIEHGVLVTCGVEKAHRYCAEGKALCLVSLPAKAHLLPSADGVRRCITCEALHKQGVRTLEEATIIEAHRATVALQGVA